MTANPYNSLEMLIKESGSKGELPVKARPSHVVTSFVYMDV